MKKKSDKIKMKRISNEVKDRLDGHMAVIEVWEEIDNSKPAKKTSKKKK